MKSKLLSALLITSLFGVAVCLNGCQENQNQAGEEASQTEAEENKSSDFEGDKAKSEEEKEQRREDYIAGLDEHIAQLQAQADESRAEAEKENSGNTSVNKDEDGAHPKSLAGACFIENSMGKSEFENFDEIINNLSDGQGYAYVDAYGQQDKVLVVAEIPYEDGGHQVAADINVYGKCDGSIKNIGNLYCESSNGVFRMNNGIFYLGSNHEIASFFCDEETGEVIHRANMYTDTDSMGEAYYIGYKRDTNSLKDKGEAIDTMDSTIYDNLVSEYEAAKTVEFTIVKKQCGYEKIALDEIDFKSELIKTTADKIWEIGILAEYDALNALGQSKEKQNLP